MAEAPIQELSSANKIRELAGMPIEAQPAPRQEEPPAWSEIKDSEDYKTLTYPEQVNLARQWGAETKQYAASLQDYTPEQDAQIDDFVNKDAVDVPVEAKAIAGLAGLAKGAGSTAGGIGGAVLGGAGGMLVGGPFGAAVGAGAGGAGGALAGGEIVERGLNKLFPTKVPISEQLAPSYAAAGEYTIPVVTGAVGGAQLVQASKTLFRELGVRRGAEEIAKALVVPAGVGAGAGTGVRAITGQEITPGTVGQDAFYGALFAGLGSGTRVKGYNREQAIALNEKVISGKATRTEVNDRDRIASEIQRTGVTEAESAKRTTVNLAGKPVFEKTEITSPKPKPTQPMQQMPTAELPPVQPVPPVELAEAGVRGNVRGTQADTAEMQRRGIITPMQESLVDLNDPVPRTGVFTIESQGINREAITPDTRGLQGEIVSEGPIVTPRTQLPTTERLELLGRTEQPSKSAIEAARTIELEKGMEERIRQSPQGRKGLRKDLEAQEPIPTPEEDIGVIGRQFEKERLVSSDPSEGQIKNPGVALAEFIEPAYKTTDGDVIDFIIENGGLISKKQARIRKNLELYGRKSGPGVKRLSAETSIAEYDSMPEMNFYERGLVHGKQSLSIDEMAQMAYDTLGVGDGTSNTFGPIIGKALKDRATLRKPDKGLELQERFIEDVLTPSNELTPISAQSLSVGDVLKVKGGDVRVVDIDPDTMQPLLDGGNKYGKQTIRTDSHVFVKTVNNKNIPTIPRPMRGRPGEAGFIVSDVQEGAAKVAKKWLTTEGNLPKEMFDIMESKGSRTQAMLKQIDFTLKDLAKEARILNGKPRLTPEQSGQLDQFLRGATDVTTLPESIQPIANQMRRQLDNLSEGLIQEGTFSQEVGASGKSKADVIRERKGEYLTRSYEKFDNPKFNVDLLRKRDPAAYSVAEKFVRDQLKSTDPAITEDQVQGRIRELVEQGRDKPMESLIQASGIGKKLGITKARQDIPEQIRYLMGEYSDPVINYARSASKMINLLQSQKQLNQLKDFGVANKLFFDKPTGTAVKQIAADGSDTRSPLNGLYAEPELVDAIESFEMMHKGGTAFQLYSMANAWVKWGKTVGSIQAQFRNPISNVLIEVVNGNFNFGGSLKPIKTVLAEFGVPKMDTKEGRAYLTRATQLGVYDNTVLNEFTQMLKDAQQYKGSTMDFAEELAGKSGNMAKKGIEALNKTYRAGDNLFKLMAWENETKQLMDGRGLSRLEAEPIAAERVKNTRPTYSRVPRIIKAFRLQPLIGQFVSWPSEMLRILPNTVRYASEDFRTPGMRGYALKRIAGLIFGTSLVVGIVKLGMWATDFNGRKMDALRRFVAPYQKNAALMPTGTNGKDVGYVDISYTSPYEIFMGPIQAAISGRDPEESIFGAIKEFTEAYIGPSILANSIISAYYGRTPQGRTIRNPQDTFIDQRLDDISYILRQNEPSTVSQIRRIVYALSGEPDTSVSKYGRVYKPSEELSALFGIRPQSLNISKSLESKASRFNTNMTDVGRIFTETYGAVGNVPEANIREQFSKMENRRRVMFDEANKDFHAAMLLGLSRSEAISAMRVGGLSGDNASAIANNKYRDYRISKSLSKQMRRELSPEEMQKRQDIGRELMMKQGE
jgi:hypothetical protein